MILASCEDIILSVLVVLVVFFVLAVGLESQSGKIEESCLRDGRFEIDGCVYTCKPEAGDKATDN